MGNILKINVSTLENYQNDFNNEFNYFKSNANNTFDSSYLNRCSDSVVKSMYNNLNTIYDVIEKGYTNINNWWTSYLSNVTTLENFLAGNCNSSGIDDPAVLSAIGYLFDLEGYENNIDDTFSIVEDKYSDMFSFDSPIVAEEENKNLLATGAVFGTSVIEGAGKVGEALLDAAWLGLCIASTPVTGLIDAGNAIYGKITGKDWSSMTKEMWNDTKAMVAEEHVKDWFDDFYENKPIGQILKRNSYNFETVRNIGSGIGYAAGVVAITIATAGVGGVVTGATSAISAASLAGVAGTAAFGRETQNAWADGDDVIKGLEKGVVGGLWEAAQYYVGGKINQLNLFGAGNKFAGSSSKALNNFLNMSTRAGLDGVDSGLDSLFEPLKKAIFNDGYRDSEGKLVNFSENTTFSERFAKYFEDSGGFKGLLENMAIGAGTSFISEIFGSVKDKNKAVEGEIVEDYNIDNPKTKLPPNQTIIDVEGERIGVDYETLDGDVIKDLPTGSKDLIEEFDAKGIEEGSIKGLPPGADDIDVTTNSKNLTGDVSTEKLDIFEEPKIPKTKGTGSSGDIETLSLGEDKPITAIAGATGDTSVLQALDDVDVPKTNITTKEINLDDKIPDLKPIIDANTRKPSVNPNDTGLTTSPKNIFGDVSTKKLDVFEEPEMPKVKVTQLTDKVETISIDKSKPIAAIAEGTGDTSVLHAMDDANVPKTAIEPLRYSQNANPDNMSTIKMTKPVLYTPNVDPKSVDYTRNVFEETADAHFGFGNNQGTLREMQYYVDSFGKRIFPGSSEYINAIKRGKKLTIQQTSWDMNGVYHLLTTKYKMSFEDAVRAAQLIDVDAGVCTYAASLDNMVMLFLDKQQLFYDKTGVPLFVRGDSLSGARMNTSEILVDLYVTVNSVQNGGKYFTVAPDGSTKFTKEITIDRWGNAFRNGDTAQVYLSDDAGSNINVINKYLKKNGFTEILGCDHWGGTRYNSELSKSIYLRDALDIVNDGGTNSNGIDYTQT